MRRRPRSTASRRTRCRPRWRRACAENAAVTTAQFNLDVAIHQVKVAEGALYPTLSLQGTVQKNYDQTLNLTQSFTAAGSLQYSAPLYQGGAEYAAVRQAKETQGQKQLDLSVARDQARLAVAQAWAQLDAAKSSIESTRNQVKAAEAALNGVREEARLGQRTTLDVLNAQQELVNARVALVQCATRPPGELLRAARLGRAAVAARARPARPDLRSAGPLPPGPRRLVRRQNPGRAVANSELAA